MSLFNMSIALTGLSTASVTVRRPSAAGYTSTGTTATPSFTTFSNVRTAFQNLRGDDLSHVPEGQRVTSWQKIWPQMVVQAGDRIDHPTKGTFIVQELASSLSEGGFVGAFVRKLGDGES